MINDKLITIIKENQFDKGWTLFRPYDLGVIINGAYIVTNSSRIVNLITHSNIVNLVLCEPCLSSRIVNEIEWANKYINLNVIVKNESILKHYPQLKFSSKIIDDNVDFNYIGVIGKQSGYFVLSEDCIEIDDSINRVYFQNEDLIGDYSFLKHARKVVIVDESGDKDYSDLIKKIQKNGIEWLYVINASKYNNKIYASAKKLNIHLCISEFTKDSIIIQNDDLSLAQLILTKLDFYFLKPIRSISQFLSKTYECCFFEDNVDIRELDEDTYSCHNGVTKKLNIIDTKVINIDEKISLMSDFISEDFDKTAVENHNVYSGEAKKTEYRFKLTPPLFDNSYKESSIYDEIHSAHEKWIKLQEINKDNIIKSYGECVDQDYGLISIFENGFTNKLNNKISSRDYSNYYVIINDELARLNSAKNSLIDICKKMFNSINEKNSETRFDKFDIEISGYKQIIKEKTELIKNGIEVLNNKRRIEILLKKIDDLEKLKERFETNFVERNNKSLNGFIVRCQDVIKGKKKLINDNSIGNIIKPKETTKLTKLEEFINSYLFLINDYLEKSIDVLSCLSKVRIPEDYTVWDKNGVRHIIIDSLEEHESTRDLCKEFNLKCITRR